MTIDAPFDRYRGVVEPDWIDYNGHMNVAYYLLAFDRATDLFLEFIGLDAAQRAESGGTTFAAEVHLRYHRELLSGEPLRISTQLLSYDSKRLRFLHEMYHGTAGYLAASAETLSLFVDLKVRRVGRWPDAVTSRLASVLQAHCDLPLSPDAGRAIAVPEIDRT